MTEFQKMMSKKVLLMDGAMGSMINTYNLKAEDFGGDKYFGCSEQLLFTKPDIIEEIHCAYVAAGADIIETNTFGATKTVLKEYGLEDKAALINLKAVEIAKKATAKAAHKVLVAGSIGPTSKALSIDYSVTYDDLYKAYLEQIDALIKGGADILLVETQLDILTAKSALDASLEAQKKHNTKLPLIVSASLNKNGFMLSGQNAEAFYLSLRHYPISAIGFNCACGPSQMKSLLKKLAAKSSIPIFAMPNAGMPDENGKYVQTPGQFAREAFSFAQDGLVNIIGGCCGTTPAHIKALNGLLSSNKNIFIPNKIKSGACGLEAVFFDDVKKPVLIGERCNSTGSRLFKNIVAQGNVDKAVSLAKKQAAAGAHILDISLANPERDEKKDALLFVPKIAQAVRTPIMADSANIETAKEIIRVTGGKSVLNSVNLEYGEDNLVKAAKLNKKHGTVIVVGCIDEEGMALTSKRKLEIAKRSHKILNEHGVDESDIIFDALVFPVASGQEKYQFSARETIEGTRLIKEHFPGCQTLLGVSNVSFGLPPASRDVLNSVLIHFAVNAGLDMAIINVEKLLRIDEIPREEIELAHQLLNNASKENVDKFAEYYRGKKTEAKEINTEDPQELLKLQIINGDKSEIDRLIYTLLETKPAIEIIKGPLTQAMDEVGVLFGNGDLIITEVLQSAEAMKKASDLLAPHLLNTQTAKRGKLLLATVKGDIHDIGKNLVSIIYKSNGFEVIDLGTNAETSEIVKQALEHKPDIIGLSGLLTRSAEMMITVAKELTANNVKAALALGGAVLTEKFIKMKVAPVYKGEVIYCATAMDGLQKSTAYCDGRSSDE